MIVENPETNSFLTSPDGSIFRVAIQSFTGWNMVTDAWKMFSISNVPNAAKIYGATGVIIDDNGNEESIPSMDAAAGLLNVTLVVSNGSPPTVVVTRRAGSAFDSTSYDDPTKTRIRLTVFYQ